MTSVPVFFFWPAWAVICEKKNPTLHKLQVLHKTAQARTLITVQSIVVALVSSARGAKGKKEKGTRRC